MQPRLRYVNSSYGAPMGRRNLYPLHNTPMRLRLSHLPLDSGGYDSGGAYWGLRRPVLRRAMCTPIGYAHPVERIFQQTPRIYYCFDNVGTVEMFIEAFDREHAKQQILEDYPHVTFYR